MDTTFHDPSSSGSNFRYGGMIHAPWGVVDQKSPGQIGLISEAYSKVFQICNMDRSAKIAND